MANWTITPFSQRSEDLCWEACARMMWHWKHKSLGLYSLQTMSLRSSMRRGLTFVQMDRFYRMLGMRSLQGARGLNVRHALNWGPVIVTQVGRTSGHAIVVSGFDKKNYVLEDPCGLKEIDFRGSLNTCQGARTRMPQSQFEQSLGSWIWYW